MQVGDNNLLEELFPETRFNSWSVGEIHIIDRRIIPNGRRDHFQPNVHFNNVLNHLGPPIREIARWCRTSSIRRKWLREFDLQHAAASEKINILNQGTLGKKDRDQHATAAQRSLATMTKITAMDDLGVDGRSALKPKVESLERELQTAVGAGGAGIAPCSPRTG